MSTDPTRRFSDRVEDYTRYRPGYPEEAVDYIIQQCHLPKDAPIADMGSGTGIFAGLLLNKGYTVYGVEPNGPMRKAAENFLSGQSRFISVNGSSEQSTLPAVSVDLVTAATAFHWFRREEARAEFRRILKPQGCVAILWNARKEDTDDFAEAYEALLRSLPDYKDVSGKYLSYEDLQNFFAEGTLQKKVSPTNNPLMPKGWPAAPAPPPTCPHPARRQELRFLIV